MGRRGLLGKDIQFVLCSLNVENCVAIAILFAPIYLYDPLPPFLDGLNFDVDCLRKDAFGIFAGGCGGKLSVFIHCFMWCGVTLRLATA
jgi:hypothetical protein